MTRRNLTHWFTGCLLAIAAASAARAQDAQLFAPVDFDLEGLPISEESGWSFNYSRLSWTATGERATIGQPGAVDLAEVIHRQNALDDAPDLLPGGVIPGPYVIQNGIQDGGPEANFAWGSRYELGYASGGNGWLVGVLDGPQVRTNKVYGFQTLTIPNTLPFQQGLPGPTFGNPTVPVGTDIDDDSNLAAYNPTVQNGGADITVPQNGFGSVHVNFETPEGFLLGFRDYWDAPDDGELQPLPTLSGPGLVFTELLVGPNGQVTAITVRRGADGITDNLDGDVIPGFALLLADINGDGTIDDDEIIGTITDFDDLHRFNVRFDQLTVRNTTETRGVEIMRTHVLDNSHMAVKEQRNHFSIGYGARFMQIRDNFWWQGLGDVLGRTYAGTDVENQIVGPQIHAKWTHQRGRVGFDFDGRFVAGYNIQDINQEGGVGENLRPGGLNSLLYAQPTYFAYGQQNNFFSPLAEMRVQASYQLTSAFALKLGYTAMHVDNISRASQIVRYRLPDMGIRQEQIGKQDIFINGVDFGIEAVY